MVNADVVVSPKSISPIQMAENHLIYVVNTTGVVTNAGVNGYSSTGMKDSSASSSASAARTLEEQYEVSL